MSLDPQRLHSNAEECSDKPLRAATWSAVRPRLSGRSACSLFKRPALWILQQVKWITIVQCCQELLRMWLNHKHSNLEDRTGGLVRKPPLQQINRSDLWCSIDGVATITTIVLSSPASASAPTWPSIPHSHDCSKTWVVQLSRGQDPPVPHEKVHVTIRQTNTRKKELKMHRSS